MERTSIAAVATAVGCEGFLAAVCCAKMWDIKVAQIY